MTFDEMKHYVDVCIDAYPENIRRLALTGGECFLLGENLDRIIAYGASRGLTVDLMTNGFWGKSYKAAYERICGLKSLGLTEIGFTVGDAHSNIIPLKNSRNAIVASARAGFKVELRLETDFAGRCPTYQKLKEDSAFMRLVNAGKIELKFWKWDDYNNKIKHKVRYAYRYRPYEESERCELLFHTISITPYGDVISCCGIGSSRNPYLRMGNIWKEPVKTLYERTFQDLLKAWIGRKGAQEILQYVHDHSDIKFHKSGNRCRACMEVFENPRIIPFLRETYDDWCDKVY